MILKNRILFFLAVLLLFNNCHSNKYDFLKNEDLKDSLRYRFHNDSLFQDSITKVLYEVESNRIIFNQIIESTEEDAFNPNRKNTDVPNPLSKEVIKIKRQLNVSMVSINNWDVIVLPYTEHLSSTISSSVVKLDSLINTQLYIKVEDMSESITKCNELKLLIVKLNEQSKINDLSSVRVTIKMMVNSIETLDSLVLH